MQKEVDSAKAWIIPGDCRDFKTYTFVLNGRAKTYEVFTRHAGSYDKITKLVGLKDD